ncbi:MAG TPA: RNA 2',3'-cyclic phosphodiesterase, partial [Hyphomicrobiaceae bacterium]|nr:RNA 2',3'-cyclic phosphodiesterase [Hyphomicrobiaceae bacterium]
MPRLFSGIELPREVRERLAILAVPISGAKWVPAEDLHLTLRFAGDIEPRIARDLAEALSAIEGELLTLRIAGLGTFGSRDQRVIWAGVEDLGKRDGLARLARHNERAARNVGLPPSPRPWKPHVTLARMRGGRDEDVARLLGEYGAYALEPFTVERFVLFSARPNV